MAVILDRWPVSDDSGPVVRGDSVAMLFAFTVDGVDEDLSGVEWRATVRSGFDAGSPVECTDFSVLPKDDFADLFPSGGSTLCVLRVGWSADQTREWRDGFVADVERVSPVQGTAVVVRRLWVQKDVSWAEGS
jgi:hypothetical protein